MSRTLLALLLPEAEPWVGDLRARFDPSARLGFPPHITLVYPFFDSDDLSAVRLRRLDEVVSAHAVPSFGLDRVDTFPSTVWLAPEPAEPIAALASALEAAFPERPRAAQEFERFVPHLSVARNLRGREALSGMVDALSSRLPPRGTVTYVCQHVRVMQRDAQGWRSIRSSPLGQSLT